jgi:hypothetical protein
MTSTTNKKNMSNTVIENEVDNKITCYSCKVTKQINQFNTDTNYLFLCDDCYKVKCCIKCSYSENRDCKHCICNCCGAKQEYFQILIHCRHKDDYIFLCNDCMRIECCSICREFCGSNLCNYCRGIF